MRTLILLFLILHTFLFLRSQNQPKLVVGIVVDQMRYDYLYRFKSNFSKNGFLKLVKKGVNCTNVNYNYVPTYTGPGHASIYTGTTPKNHGIIANDWFDRASKNLINCVQDNTVKPIGTSATENKRSPRLLKTTTVTDELKLSNPASKVISVSIKDRGAILPGGHLSNGSYWYDYTNGIFVTSSFYTEALPQWLNDFNTKNNAHSSLKNWELLLEESRYSSKDSSIYEILLPGKKSPTFPYNFEDMPNKNLIFPTSPTANAVLTDLAIQSILQEEMGLDDDTDFLAISYSSTDIVGHLFGTDSREVEDMYLRLDLELGRLLKFLDKKIGKNNYLLFLTADHAAVPVPQSLIDQHLPGGYFFVEDKITQLNEKIREAFNIQDTLIQKLINNQIYIDHALMQGSLHSKENELEKLILDEIKKWPEVKEVYSKKSLNPNTTTDLSFFQLISNGYFEDRSGDFAFILDYGYLSKSSDNLEARKGTSHGSPYKYDTHVPLLWYGFGLPGKSIHTDYNITDIAPSLERILHVQGAGSSFGKPIKELFEK